MQDRPRRPRIADVAREAGVSKTAVSFAFNSPGRLNPATAARIRDVADLLGYRPNPVARMLAQRRTMAVGILTPQPLSVTFSNPFFGTFGEGAAEAAEGAGYGLFFVSPLQGSLARAIGRATVDGFVAIGLTEDHPEVEQIRRSGLPIVLVDAPAFPEHGSIEVDDEEGARGAAAHLLGLGHRELLVIGVEPPVGREARPYPARADGDDVPGRRLRGYRSALAARRVALGDERVVVGPATFAGGAAAFNRAWEDGLRFSGVLAMSDAMAVGVLRAARDLGLAVPRDLSVVGFDDLEIARQTEPPLTTVHQPVRRKGAEAVRILLSLVDGRDGDRAEHLRLPTRLIVRGSSGPAPRPGGPATRSG